ncbi:MAG: hypothetical protein A3C50_02250 [Candidatus Staskawiczbacteria bacterium RIFCSPHIGHO2_02_FULL_43_16]|uniref:SHS2 domain-containing protein n=1 Tax=Candidatus Staskawiczbacteria bacterium RIFCSPHIGHO2_01_FULL_41_41 TaxID=1802203 RepID=A0A1G2HVV4_9BACT|nr:MAG: hypothetical protein A2822_00620 [Candidatus Staskawiczbacteria bacterium RIFCSPHIGHO2_01_FULL_41_41]OGZ68499.1 MAG: hypothetical protein A3C50_02250 [Candidatus Staskawiczbacteria bacterium RIFCSPHIGHO2_02_FULL_43_16]OGZ74303.1 MAG: hypothetical protein A3A12_02685 [Candidatus Staskawiczbacteria bacterium RIFCSPLOWO2_01_FULL_43_17b]
MFKFLNLQPELFALDINDSSVKVVKLEKRKKNFFLASYNELRIAPNIVRGGVILQQEVLVKIIRGALEGVKGKKIATKHVVLSLPEEKSFSQIIQMPRMTEQELKKAVPFEAENYIPLPIDSVYLDFQVINAHQEVTDSAHLDILVNAMPKYIVDSYVACAKAAGLVPCVLEIESQSIARALVENGQAQKPVALIDVGKDNTSFIIFSGSAPRFTTSVPFSSKQLTVAIEGALHVTSQKAEELKVKNGLVSKKGKENKEAILAMTPLLEDFALKIKKYIGFYHGHSSHDYFPSDDDIEKIILCGGGANLKGLAEFLSTALHIPVGLGDPFINIIPCNKGERCPIIYQKALSYTTAFGLALRAAANQEDQLND